MTRLNEAFERARAGDPPAPPEAPSADVETADVLPGTWRFDDYELQAATVPDGVTIDPDSPVTKEDLEHIEYPFAKTPRSPGWSWDHRPTHWSSSFAIFYPPHAQLRAGIKAVVIAAQSGLKASPRPANLH